MNARSILFGLLALSPAIAETLVLRDGTVLEGNYFGGDSQRIRFVVDGEMRSFFISDIAQLNVIPPAPPPAPEPVQCPEVAPAPVCEPIAAETPKPAAPRAEPAPETPAAEKATLEGEIPLGTILAVRLVEAVDSRNDRPDRIYRATLDEPVAVAGKTVLPRGLSIEAGLMVREQTPAGNVLAYGLELKSILIDDQTVPLRAEQTTSAPGRQGGTLGGIARTGGRLGRVIGLPGGRVSREAERAGGEIEETMAGVGELRLPANTRLEFELQGTLHLGSSESAEQP